MLLQTPSRGTGRSGHAYRITASRWQSWAQSQSPAPQQLCLLAASGVASRVNDWVKKQSKARQAAQGRHLVAREGRRKGIPQETCRNIQRARITEPWYRCQLLQEALLGAWRRLGHLQGHASTTAPSTHVSLKCLAATLRSS